MAEYWVTIYEEVGHRVCVEADSRELAYEEAYKIITEYGDDNYSTESEGFTGRWEVEED